MFPLHSTVIILLFSVPLTPVVSYNSRNFKKFSAFSAEDPSKNATYRLFETLIGDDGRVYACSGRNFFAFEKNGSIVWTVHLNYTCNDNISPVHGGSRKIYLVAENRVLKIHPLKIGTSESSVDVFFGPEKGAEETGEIIGIAVSVSTSCVIINVKNMGLFAYKLQGHPLWSAGPVLDQHGYRQGCRKNITECYFTSIPVIDQCEASIYVSNTVGELYSLSVRDPYFKWIQDLRSYGKTFIITPGNNGQLYVTIPDKSLILALEASTGNILWEGSFGPLSSADYEPIVDVNGWISIGSLDGFLYSFSPTGVLKKYQRSARLGSVIQVNPILDCSGYGVYISHTELEGNISQTNGEYSFVSAVKPRSVVITFLSPSSGFVYWSDRNLSNFLFNMSHTELQHFVMDESTLLTFVAISRNGNPLACRTTRQRLASSCSQVDTKNISIYTGNESMIILFLLFESVLLVFLAAVVRYCCIFWKKRKLQSLDLGKFLEKRHSLRLQKKEYDRTITELEQKASEESLAHEVIEKLRYLVKEREGVKRKLTTTYSLGRDGEKSKSKTQLPLYNGKSRSYSFQDAKKESVTIFHTLSESTSSDESSMDEKPVKNVIKDKEFALRAKEKGKAPVQVQSSSDDGIHESE